MKNAEELLEKIDGVIVSKWIKILLAPEAKDSTSSNAARMEESKPLIYNLKYPSEHKLK